MSTATAEDDRIVVPSRDRRIVVIAVAVTLLPLVVAAVRALVAHRVATNADDALIELRVRDVGTSHTPLIGSYQRFGFNQPGPLLLYLLAIPYRLFGSTFAGAQVGALLLNGLAVAGMAWTVLRRRGMLAAIACLAFVAVLMHAMGAERLSDPWEPNATILLVALLLLLVWEVAGGAAWALPVLTAVGSLLAQAQSSLALVVVVLLGFALLALVVAARRAQPPVSWRKPAITAAIVLVVVWMPPLLHELGGEPSNVAKMWDFIRESNGRLGLRNAARSVGLQLGQRGSWWTGTTPLRPFDGTVDVGAGPALPIGALVVGLAAAVAVRRRAWLEARLAVTVLVGCFAAVLSLSRITGPLFDWLLLWTWALAMVAWFAVALCVWAVLPSDWRAKVRTLALPVLLAVVVGLAGVATQDAMTNEHPRDRVRDAVLRLAGPARDAARGAGGPVLVDSTVEVPAELFADGEVGVEFLALALERSGVHVLVHAPLANRFGNHRVDNGQAVAELRLVSDDGASAPAGSSVLATVDPLGPDDRAELARIEVTLRARGILDAQLAALPPGLNADDIRMIGRRDGLRSYPKISVVLIAPS
ncbi:MAG: hypothetical protein QOJ67_1978 [Acidimicrobiaceae bacterium]